MPNPCQGCSTEEECTECILRVAAALYDQITSNLTQLNVLLELAKEKGLRNHAESVPIAASIDRLARDVERSSRAFYEALGGYGEPAPGTESQKGPFA